MGVALSLELSDHQQRLADDVTGLDRAMCVRGRPDRAGPALGRCQMRPTEFSHMDAELGRPRFVRVRAPSMVLLWRALRCWQSFMVSALLRGETFRDEQRPEGKFEDSAGD